jgi:hypothetical protein
VRTIGRSLARSVDEPWRPDALPALKYDIRRARAELDFAPQMPLERGVRDAVLSFDRDETCTRSDGSTPPDVVWSPRATARRAWAEGAGWSR